MDNKRIYTVGHSNHSIDYFLELLHTHNINCIVDVRSMPASKFNPQYNQVELKATLKSNTIVYMHFKDEFGARQESEEYIDENGQVNFQYFRKSREFQNGVERIDLGVENGYRIALMCSEGNPLECHRFSMISGYFSKLGFQVLHILRDKSAIEHQQLEKKLLERYSDQVLVPSLFESTSDTTEMLETAYTLHNKEIGWKSIRRAQKKTYG